jgi:hypothetical protein
MPGEQRTTPGPYHAGLRCDLSHNVWDMKDNGAVRSNIPLRHSGPCSRYAEVIAHLERRYCGGPVSPAKAALPKARKSQDLLAEFAQTVPQCSVGKREVPLRGYPLSQDKGAQGSLPAGALVRLQGRVV